MPSYTPVATPVVPAPQKQVEIDNRRARAELVAPVTVITPQGEIELNQGSLLIGRLPECDILLADPLASRMHARLSVHDSSVVVEDLHSTNGVYVNGLKVGHSTVLCEGDRILIGTCEISLFENRDSSLMRIRVARQVVTATTTAAPTPQRSPLHSVDASSPRKPTPEARMMTAPAMPKVPPSLDKVPSTARADALKMIGGLADRLAATGNIEEAAQVLSGHLKRILKGANSGLTVTPEVAVSAAHYALTLARWTKLQLWADYVVELHLSARLVMSTTTLVAFEDAVSKLGCDRMLLGYYVDALSDRTAALDMDERRRVERLRFLARE